MGSHAFGKAAIAADDGGRRLGAKMLFAAEAFDPRLMWDAAA